MSQEHPLYSNRIERDYWATIDRATAKRMGQVWTPYEVARFMAAWLEPVEGTILDPAVGTGVLLRALCDPRFEATERTLIGADYDAAMIARFEEFAEQLPATVETRVGDGLVACKEESYDGLIMNPPSVGSGRIFDKEELLVELDRETGLRFSRSMNLYGIFMLRAALSLNVGGRAAILTPSAWLDASSGRRTKQFLLDRGLLRGLVLFDAQYEGVKQTTNSSIVLLAAEPHLPAPPVAFLALDQSDELTAYEDELNKPDSALRFGDLYEASKLNPKSRWTDFFSAR